MKWFLALIFSVLWLGASRAETVAVPVDDEIQGDLDIYGTPRKEIAVIKAEENSQPAVVAINLPDCKDLRLLAQVKQTITQFLEQTPPAHTYDYRRRKLSVKNIGDFDEQDLQSFVPADNYPVADRLIELKINHHLTNADFRLCRSNDHYNTRPVYLLLSPSPQGILVDIINFGKAPRHRGELQFYFKN